MATSNAINKQSSNAAIIEANEIASLSIEAETCAISGFLSVVPEYVYKLLNCLNKITDINNSTAVVSIDNGDKVLTSEDDNFIEALFEYRETITDIINEVSLDGRLNYIELKDVVSKIRLQYQFLFYGRLAGSVSPLKNITILDAVKADCDKVFGDLDEQSRSIQLKVLNDFEEADHFVEEYPKYEDQFTTISSILKACSHHGFRAEDAYTASVGVNASMGRFNASVEQMINDNRGVGFSVVRSLLSSTKQNDFDISEELTSTALYEAAARYSCRKGNFTTYVHARAKASYQDYIADTQSQIHVPASTKRRLNAVNEFTKEFEEQFSEKPSLDIIAKSMNTTRESIQATVHAGSFTSINMDSISSETDNGPFLDESTSSIYNEIVDSKCTNFEADYLKEDINNRVRDAITTLMNSSSANDKLFIKMCIVDLSSRAEICDVLGLKESQYKTKKQSIQTDLGIILHQKRIDRDVLDLF